MNSKVKSIYQRKARESFNTKLNLFFFSLALNKSERFDNNYFLNFKISKELVVKYTAEYWQGNANELIDNVVSVTELFNRFQKLKAEYIESIKNFEKDYVDSFPEIFPVDKFEELISEGNEDNCCHYCQITMRQIEELADKKKIFKKNFRGWSLEIDRKDSNFEYTPNNCVLACYWCNNAKTDEFTYDEFKLLVGPSIQKIWENRLK